MKRALLICLCFLFFCGCASSGKYEEGYSAGYDAGYKAALETRTMPDITSAQTARATSQPTTTPSEDFKVYISSSFTMHKKSTCSGMKNYIAMPYSIAKDYFTKKCGTCFK